jgi:hypothetical protein
MAILDRFLLESVRVNFWVATRGDGIAGCGSQTDPFNASTGQFDAVMVKILATPEAQSAPITVYLGPGIFETKGYRTDNETSLSGWQPKKGMKIIGSGIEVTTIKLISATAPDAHYCALGHALSASTQADYCEIAELSIDCGLPPSPNMACGAIRLMGSHTRIRRVRAHNWGTRSGSQACVVFSLITATSGAGGIQTVDAGLEDCLANDPAADGNASRVTAFHAGGKEEVLTDSAEGFGTGPFIRNCFVDCGLTTPSKTGNYCGVSMGWCRLGIIEGNQIHNLDLGGPVQDRATTRDLVVRDNFYRNVARGPYWNLGIVNAPPALALNATNSIIRDDTFDATGFTAKATTSTADHKLQAGDRVQVSPAGGSPPQYQGVFQITNVPAANQFRYQMESKPSANANNGGSAQKVFGVGKLLLEDNYFELTAGATPTAIEMEDNNGGGTPYQESPDYVHGEVIIRGNRIRYVDGVTPITVSDVFITVNGAKNVILGNNIFESTNLSPIQTARCGPVTTYNNLDPVQFATEAEDALVMSLFNRRAR